MCDVYEGSVFTFAATAAQNGNGGYCVEVPQQYTGVQVYSPDPAQPAYFREVYEHWPFTGAAYDNSQNVREIEYRTSLPPLLKWAWVFQERQLSPRVMHFGNEIV